MQMKFCFFFKLKSYHNAKNCDKNFTCLKCKGKHRVSICTYTAKDNDKINYREKEKMKIKMKSKRRMSTLK